MYEKITENIKVSVEPLYLDEDSRPEDSHYVWAYHVRIENMGQDIVQLISRYWRITDASGRVQEVEGTGVVGEQPVIEPGEHFEYSSGTPLSTPSGIMFGSYRMVRADGEIFIVDVPAFSLDSPYEHQVMN